MAIWRPAVLTAHVLSALLQSLAGLAIFIQVAIAVGFRPTATVLEWLEALGLPTLFALTLTWLSVAFGLYAKIVVGASSLPLPLPPFLGSGFVHTNTLPVGLRCSRNTSRSHRSTTPCAGCPSAATLAPTGSSRSAGASASPRSATWAPNASTTGGPPADRATATNPE